MSICTACGAFYKYNGRLHCTLDEAPIRRTPEPELIAHILVHPPTGREAICGGYGKCRWCTERHQVSSNLATIL